MDLTFKTKKVRELCEKEAVAKRELGAPCARKLRARMADLQAAGCVTALVAGRPHPLERDRLGEFAVDLEGGRRLVFKPANEPVPKLDDGTIDWSKVTKVQIVFVGDYHA